MASKTDTAWKLQVCFKGECENLMLKMAVKEKEKSVNKPTEGSWNLSHQTLIINFMLIGFVSLRFHCSMCFVDLWVKGLALAYGL